MRINMEDWSVSFNDLCSNEQWIVPSVNPARCAFSGLVINRYRGMGEQQGVFLTIRIIFDGCSQKCWQKAGILDANAGKSAPVFANRDSKLLIYHGIWWRRRESNPRPQDLCLWLYMLIRSINLTRCYLIGKEDNERFR